MEGTGHVGEGMTWRRRVCSAQAAWEGIPPGKCVARPINLYGDFINTVGTPTPQQILENPGRGPLRHQLAVDTCEWSVRPVTQAVDGRHQR